MSRSTAHANGGDTTRQQATPSDTNRVGTILTLPHQANKHHDEQLRPPIGLDSVQNKLIKTKTNQTKHHNSYVLYTPPSGVKRNGGSRVSNYGTARER